MNKLALILVLCCVVAVTNSFNIVKNNSDRTLACCGTKTFDTTLEVCCINAIFPIPDQTSNNQAACCGNRLMTNDQICCPVFPDGPATSADHAISELQTCCGTAGYDSATQQCCGGTVQPLITNNVALQCCGSRSFVPGVDLCCPVTSDVIKNNIFIGPVTTSTVVVGAAATKTCCGSSAFDQTTQLCCGLSATDPNARVVSNTAGNLVCCGTTTVDNSIATCCCDTTTQTFNDANGVSHIVPTTTCATTNGASLPCCVGSTRAVPAGSICCAGTVVSNPTSNLQCCGTKTFDPATQTCCSVTSSVTTRIGTDCAGCGIFVVTLTTTFQVTSNVASGQCCGLQGFNPANQLCCLGKVNSNTLNDRSCCGTTTYSATLDLCCPDVLDFSARPLVGGLSKANTGCCGTSTFNTLTQTCPCGKPVIIAQDINTLHGLGACCGTTQYNAISATCCLSSFGAFLYPVNPAVELQCCEQDGKSLFNKGYQVCCDKPKSLCPNPPSLAIRDVDTELEEFPSYDFRTLRGHFTARDTYNFAGLVEKHARHTRELEDLDAIEETEDTEDTEEIEKKQKKNNNKKKSSNKNRADSRDRTSGNIPNNNKNSFDLVQCGDSCCNGQGYFQAFQACCGNGIVGFNVIDKASSFSPTTIACCGDNIYNTLYENCCTEVISLDKCGFTQKANYGIYDNFAELCCTAQSGTL